MDCCYLSTDNFPSQVAGRSTDCSPMAFSTDAFNKSPVVNHVLVQFQDNMVQGRATCKRKQPYVYSHLMDDETRMPG